MSLILNERVGPGEVSVLEFNPKPYSVSLISPAYNVKLTVGVLPDKPEDTSAGWMGKTSIETTVPKKTNDKRKTATRKYADLGTSLTLLQRSR